MLDIAKAKERVFKEAKWYEDNSKLETIFEKYRELYRHLSIGILYGASLAFDAMFAELDAEYMEWKLKQSTNSQGEKENEH